MSTVLSKDFAQLQLISSEKDMKRFLCQICGNLMKSPLQTIRGNAACALCYHKNDEERTLNRICPIDKEPISLTEIFRDKAKEKEILNLKCFCTNKDLGCQWSGTIRELQKHLCEYEKIKSTSSDDIIKKNGENTHKKESVGATITRDCFFKDFGCEFKAETKEEMEKHIRDNAIIHVALQNSSYTGLKKDYEEVLQDNKSLKAVVGSLHKKLEDSEANTKRQIAQLTQALHDLAKKIPTEKMIQTESKPSQKQENKLKEITHVVNKNSSNISDIDLRFQLHENTTYDGHVLWKIDNFKRRRNDAITGRITALHSSPCFTSQYGYKFCLRLYLNGDGMGKGTHLSLFLVIMKSEYDNILEWPFKKQVKFTLINQQNRSNDIVERMSGNKDSSSFQKPRKEMNIASGCPLFVEHNRLDREGFLKDDAIFLDVEIL